MNVLRILSSALLIVFSHVALTAQIYTPGGGVSSSSSGSGIGISEANPTSQLHIKYHPQNQNGLLYLRSYTNSQALGGPISQPYALRLQYSNDDIGTPLTTVFNLGSSGTLQVGNFTSIPLINLNATQTDIAESFGVYSGNNYLRIRPHVNALVYGGEDNFTIRKGGFATNPLLTVQEVDELGRIGINSYSPEAPLHIVGEESGSELNKGVFISTNDQDESNSAFKVSADGNETFTINENGAVGIGTYTPGAQFEIANDIDQDLFLMTLPALSSSDYFLRCNIDASPLGTFTVFEVNHTGLIRAGGLHNVSNQSLLSGSDHNFYRSIGVYGVENYIRFDALNSSVVWNGADDLSIQNPDFGNSEIQFTKEGNLVVRNESFPGSGPSGNLYGIEIITNAFYSHDFALKVNSGHGDVFTVGTKGHVHIGPNLNYAIPSGDDYFLYVAKGIRTEGMRIDVSSQNGWADYVFDKDYDLQNLDELAKYVEEHKHLPGVPTTQEVLEDGIDVAEMNKILLEKIEELTLHLINLNEELQEIKDKNEQ